MSKVPTTRKGQSRADETASLGLLAELAGTWTGEGFNLIARPDEKNGSPLFLELNQTQETLSIIPVSSSIPNRGFAAPDVELFGLTYLQKVTDRITTGALHIEPGIWVHVVDPAAPAVQSVFRLGTIPHGNALLAQGTAVQLKPFTGNPFKPSTHSLANTAPFAIGSPMLQPGTQGGFPPYDLTKATNFRTPFGDTPPIALPTAILGVPLQAVVNDPALLLDAALAGQTIKEMVVISIATVADFPQLNGATINPNPIAGGGGGVENIPFLEANADASTVVATFWIEKIAGVDEADDFMQLQYVQTVLLDFPPASGAAPIHWPHVSVATLRKTFGGQ